ncbi:hypothetical protein ATANTOWER_000800 [Ataeniobius toweri]|uniref:Uncharacterized protein n=1 Tax=Ataeniobius toweri TaxID=208326 RepID=A0ABU7BZ08_9TELE|nr:hypothetical protein [Ataeniobius toweri]
MVPVGRLRSPTSQPQLIGLLLQLHDIPYCLFSPPISGIATATGTTDLTATATGGSIDNRGREHSPLALYVSNLPGIWSKLFRRWELNTLLAKGSCQTFPADPHYTFGPAKSVRLPPLPADPIHHQVVIGGQLSPSLHPSVPDMWLKVRRHDYKVDCLASLVRAWPCRVPQSTQNYKSPPSKLYQIVAQTVMFLI